MKKRMLVRDGDEERERAKARGRERVCVWLREKERVIGEDRIWGKDDRRDTINEGIFI